MFHVYNKANNEGFHEIKNEEGTVVATAANTSDQTATTLEVMGHADADVEIVYDQAVWDAIGNVILHLGDWNDEDKWYKLSLGMLKAFAERVKAEGLQKGWRWFADQVDYTEDLSGPQPIKRVDHMVDHTLDEFFLDWMNHVECVCEWEEVWR